MSDLTPRPHRAQKLTKEDARAILEEWHGRKASLRQLAARYGVTCGAIHAVCRGRSHADVYQELFQVTKCDEESQSVTVCHDLSHCVTGGHTDALE